MFIAFKLKVQGQGELVSTSIMGISRVTVWVLNLVTNAKSA